MKLSNAILALLGIASLLSGGISQNAQAVPITGAFGFDGSGLGTTNSGVSAVTFNNPLTFFVGLGNYSGIPVGTTANFAPISWIRSGSNVLLTSANSPEWTINFGGTTYQYSIISLQNATLDIAQGGVNVVGLGIASINGTITRDPTFLSFVLQGHLDSQGNSTDLTFSMITACSLSCGPPRTVPDTGSAIALLGVAATGWKRSDARVCGYVKRP